MLAIGLYACWMCVCEKQRAKGNTGHSLSQTGWERDVLTSPHTPLSCSVASWQDAREC